MDWPGFLVLILASLPFIFEKDIPKEIVDEKYSSSASKFLTQIKEQESIIATMGSKRALLLFLVHGAMASLHTWEPWWKS